jgi:hypothetical protein
MVLLRGVQVMSAEMSILALILAIRLGQAADAEPVYIGSSSALRIFRVGQLF